MSEFDRFMAAIRSNDLAEVKRCFAKKYINKRSNGRKPLHEATIYDNNGDTVRYLLREGCNIEDEATRWRRRSIHFAAWRGNTAAMTALVEGGCSLDCVTSNGETPIDIATIYNNDECVRILRSAMAESTKTEPYRSVLLKAQFGDYEKVKKIGQGGFGSVWQCGVKNTKEYVAIKELSFVPNDSITKEIKSLANEIKIYGELPIHANIVRYLGTYRDDNAMYIIMEYLEYGSIADYLAKNGPLEPREIAHYSKQILNGLQFLHQRNIIHRDIKGAHILRDTDNKVKLCGFGLSHTLEIISASNNECASTVVPANTICGTSYWMAPEVITGERYTFPADVWSLGATIIEMLTGKHPYPNLSTTQAIFKIGNTKKLEYNSPQTIPDELQLFIDQMLVPDQHKRATIEQLLSMDFVMFGVDSINSGK